MTRYAVGDYLFGSHHIDSLPENSLIEDCDDEHFFRTYDMSFNPRTGFHATSIWRNCHDGREVDTQEIVFPIKVRYVPSDD